MLRLFPKHGAKPFPALTKGAHSTHWPSREHRILRPYIRRSALDTGLAFVPIMGIVLPANLLAARVSERFSALATIAAGAANSAAGCAALLGISSHTSWPAQRGSAEGLDCWCRLLPRRCWEAWKSLNRVSGPAFSTPRSKPEVLSASHYSARSSAFRICLCLE